MDKNVLIIVIVFFTCIIFMGCMVLAFNPEMGSNKKHVKRLEKVRDRFSTSLEVRTEAQMRRILTRQDNKLDSFVNRYIPRPDELRMRLLRTGKDLNLGKYGVICAGIAGGVMLLVLGVFKQPFLLALLAGLFLGLFLPHMIVGMLIKKRQKKFNLLFPDAIDLMVRGLRSGLPITESLGIVGREIPDPVSTEFRTVTDKIKIGRTMEQALTETAERIDTPEFNFFIITLSVQRETGGNLAETLSNLSDILRKRQQLRLKVKALSSEAKASAWIIGLLPFIMFVVINLVSPDYMKPFWTNIKLQIISAGGILWLLIGVFIMSRMINFEA